MCGWVWGGGGVGGGGGLGAGGEFELSPYQPDKLRRLKRANFVV